MLVDAIRMGLEYAKAPLTVWVVGSVLACTLVVNVLWLLRSTDVQRRLYWQPLAQAGRFLFFLGIPYLVLGGWPRRPFSGLLSPDDLGLAGVGPSWPAARWLGTMGTGLGLGLLAFLVLLVAWRGAGGRTEAGRLGFPPRPAGALVVDGLYLELHWAFYRAAPAVILGDVYGGALVGLALIYLEWGLNPLWRLGWRDAGHRRSGTPQAGERWLRAALAVVSAVLFLVTRNLWACLGVHWLAELAFHKL